MRFTIKAVLSLLLGLPGTRATIEQTPLGNNPNGRSVSVKLFSELEELSRVVDIAYCVGLTSSGISKPFKCLSRCSGFSDFELITTWNTGPLQSDSCGYVALDHGKRRIIAAFRGTYSIANTVVDLSTIPQKYEPYPGEDGSHNAAEVKVPRCENCTVHSGFHTSWVNTRKIVLPPLESNAFLFPGYQLHLVGHSLGGAVAALAGLDLQARGFSPIVTTFGEPRIGNKALSEYLDERFELNRDTSLESSRAAESRFRRITHIDDPVPLLPLSEWGYAMHGGEIFISKSSLSPDLQDVEICRGDNDPKCIAGQDSSISDNGSGNTITRRSFSNRGRDLLTVMRNEIDEIRHESWGIPARYKLWQLFFAHRDYFWRLGLCVPSGGPLGSGSKYSAVHNTTA